MLVHMITAMIVTGFAVLMTWLVFRTLKRRMPGYLIPILIGACLIGYGMYSEYSWRARTLAQMPSDIVPVLELSSKSMFSPWAYVVPRIDQLTLVDTRDVRRHADLPGMALVELLIVRRLFPTLRVAQIVDCTEGRRADIDPQAPFGAGGLPEGLQWEKLPAGHRLLAVVCRATA